MCPTKQKRVIFGHEGLKLSLTLSVLQSTKADFSISFQNFMVSPQVCLTEVPSNSFI